MTLHELARQTLDERWIPISDADTLDEICCIRSATDCEFCQVFSATDEGKCFDISFALKCPLDVGRDCCDGEFDNMTNADTFEEAHEFAMKIRRRIEALLEQPNYEIEINHD